MRDIFLEGSHYFLRCSGIRPNLLEGLHFHSEYYTVGGGSALPVERINLLKNWKSENFLFQFFEKLIIKEPTVFTRERTKPGSFLLWLGISLFSFVRTVMILSQNRFFELLFFLKEQQWLWFLRTVLITDGVCSGFLSTAQNWWVMFGALERPEDVAGVLIIHKQF